MNNILKLITVAVLLTITSCATPEKIGYLRDIDYNKTFPCATAPELRIQPGDIISIQVLSEEAELSAPFFPLSVTEGTGTTDSAPEYLVDRNGNIDFPVLGKVHVADYTMRQISDNLKYDIISRGYIKDPIVNVRLTNFSVTVLGETGQTVLKIDEDNFNILQLIAKTGGTSDNAKIRDIMVIRKENGEERAYSVNLQSKDVFVSPVFYLQQNDIVYVKPRGIRFSNSGQTAMTFINTIVGIGTAFIYIMLWNTSK
ncbi:MAG: polysaccharide biosynthesis/export family protein [Bacteroidales bacterium]|jgi:polysaccharide export outer membrane protein|nr:polysaccharide biosynthesis/export family protein [Bacteroidales bacterium]